MAGADKLRSGPEAAAFTGAIPDLAAKAAPGPRGSALECASSQASRAGIPELTWPSAIPQGP